MLKKIFKKIVSTILIYEARLVVRRFKPKVIGVAGSVGKTATKDAIFSVLHPYVDARKSDKSYNSDFGVPLAILGEKTAWGNVLGWTAVLARGAKTAVFSRTFPEYLVLEVGSDRPGDISAITKWLNFDVVVLTSFPDLPVHVEFFDSAESLHDEDFKLAESVSENGLVIINSDEKNIARLTAKIKAPIKSYGLNAGSDVGASDIRVQYNEQEKISGMSFHLLAEGKTVPVVLPGIVGEHQIYPILAAVAVGLNEKLNLLAMIEGFSDYVSPTGRMRIIAGNKESIIIDDTYNSSPVAVSAGIATLKSINTAGRKIAVLGDMLELGSYTVEAHRDVGKELVGVIDELFTVGLRAKFIGESLLEQGFDEKHWHHFPKVDDVGDALEKIIKKDDIIFIKGSQGVRLEKAVEEIMAEPERALELLCRQDSYWKN